MLNLGDVDQRHRLHGIRYPIDRRGQHKIGHRQLGVLGIIHLICQAAHDVGLGLKIRRQSRQLRRLGVFVPRVARRILPGSGDSKNRPGPGLHRHIAQQQDFEIGKARFLGLAGSSPVPDSDHDPLLGGALAHQCRRALGIAPGQRQRALIRLDRFVVLLLLAQRLAGLHGRRIIRIARRGRLR